MRSNKALFATILFMLLLLFAAPMPVRAVEDEEEADEYDVTARVVRMSLLTGEVTLRRAGSNEWERATLNLPLVEGDTLATGRDARLEIQIDARNFVRVGADSVLRIVTLREEGIALSLVQGTATLRLAHFDHAKEYFEIDAPKTTMTAEKPGLYRLDVGSDGGVRLTVRDGGQARIYSETSGFTLRDGRSAELITKGEDEGDWQLDAASASDDWDGWVREREHELAERLRYEARERYYDTDIWGAEELDAYGDWVNAGDYGWVWRPSTTVINNYYNWAPYRHGQWRWCPPYGWTWVGDEPWGWAPYHYGRWVYYNNNWCWAPRGQGHIAGRNWWRPALVAFININTSSDEQVAWYPLTYGQHDPYRRNGRNHRRNDRQPSTPRSYDRDNPRHRNPAYWRGVTSLPARHFGRDRERPQPASADVAQRAFAGEPGRARLPIWRRDVDQNGDSNRDRGTRQRRTPERPVVPSATLPERATGAANRAPGVSLDESLRRTRFYNGRNPHPRTPASPTQTVTPPTDRSTGAVERPERPIERPSRTGVRPPRERDGGVGEDRSYRNNGPAPERPERTFRPERPAASAADSTVAPVEPEHRERRPVHVPRTEAPSPSVETPARPVQRPDRTDRPSRPERPRGTDREAPATRPERRREREEAPERSEAAPTERHDASAQRQEAPAPTQEQQALHTEPARVEPPRPEPRPEPPAPRSETATPQPEPPASTPEPPAPAPEPPAPQPSASAPEPSTSTPEPAAPPASAPEPPAAAPAPAPQPEPQVATPEPPAPREEAPPPPREEPAPPAETPSSPPSSSSPPPEAPAPSPPPEAPPPTPAEPPREREAVPERPAE
ncbi:MAG TPA: DUF6600 domain-containing protein [Pyrinomonadaceae bacterium]